MSHPIRFVLALHNHQPIGNFHGVIEQAYQDSYLPLLKVFAGYPNLKLALHTSGSLMEWLDEHHPEYLEQLAQLVAADRVEIIGGAFFEPILTMLPSRDRIGQIRLYTQWLENRLGAKVRGMWIPERVWEQNLASDLAKAGVEYTLLDDFHFKCAGLTEEELYSYYLTEDDGRLLKVFPGSERLRYVIPFGSPQDTIDYLARIHQQHPGAAVVFGDDGEKFGTWPDTHKHVYTDGWLARFFDALSANDSWIRTTTLADCIDNVPPVGKVYLPDASYREMTEWALPAQQLAEFEQTVHDVEHEPSWPRLKKFVRGGIWRNFKVKYPEADEMYARMMQVSQRLAVAEETHQNEELVERARMELYRGQCNCSYWHGAFGGIYLPHLRNAVYQHLIAADNLLDAALGRHEPWAEVASGDFNLDARQEVQLASDKLVALLAPGRGGQLYELDVRTICHNLGATLTRRPEAYHRKVLAGAQANDAAVASIHDRVVFKQPGLDQRVQYDNYPRKSLLDHFWSPDTTLQQVAAGQAAPQGDFLQAAYEARLRRSPGRVQVQLSRTGLVNGRAVKLSKVVALEAGKPALEIAYSLEGLEPGVPVLLAVEFNFAGLPAGADDRYFHDGHGQRHGQLGKQLDLVDVNHLALCDEWLGIDVSLVASCPTRFWTFPVETVSQSEGGFELVHQSVAVLPHWLIVPDQSGAWSASLVLGMDTRLAESRHGTSTLVGSA